MLTAEELDLDSIAHHPLGRRVPRLDAKRVAGLLLLWEGPGIARRPFAGNALRALPWKGMQTPK